MAQSKVADVLRLECSICFSDFVQPKELPCQHIFCLACLEKYCEEEKDNDMKPCPLCRREFCIPEGGVNSLPDTVGLSVAKSFPLQDVSKHEKYKCEPCGDIGEDVEARLFCVECDQYLCTRCKKLHSTMTYLKGHTIIAIHEYLDRDKLLKIKSKLCSTHITKEIEFYCCDCHKPLCSICYFESHRKHDSKLLRELVKQKKEEFTKDENRVRKSHDEVCDLLRKLQHEPEKTLLNVSATEQCIEATFDNIIERIMSYKTELIDKLNTYKSRRLNEIKCKQVFYQKRDLELVSLLAQSRAEMERVTDCEIIRVADDLHKRAEELIKSQDERNKQQLPENCIKFIPSAELTTGDIGRFFGELVNTVKPKATLRSNQPVGVNSIRLTANIRGVTTLDGRMFVVTANQPKIFVYDPYTAKEKFPIEVSGMNDPQGISYCSDKVLYIPDGKQECVYRVSTNGAFVESLQLRENYLPLGVSTTSRYTVLVTVWIKNTGGESRVVEYTEGGHSVRDIELDRSIKRAWQTVQLTSNQFIICHGWFTPYHRLCIINSEGQIIASYGREKGRSKGHLNEPRSIAIDNNESHVFVADSGNHRVLMFTNELILLGEVQTPNGLSFPSRLFFDSSSDSLFIGENNPSRVSIVHSHDLIFSDS